MAWPSPNTCFGGLIWFPMRYDLLMLIFLSVLVFLLLLVAALISIQLMRTPEIDHNERISASRMTYFLIVAALIYVSIPTALFFPLADNRRLSSSQLKYSLFDENLWKHWPLLESQKSRSSPQEWSSPSSISSFVRMLHEWSSVPSKSSRLLRNNNDQKFDSSVLAIWKCRSAARWHYKQLIVYTANRV